MQSERAREAAEYRAKGSEPRERSPPQPTAILRGNAQRQADRRRCGKKPHFCRGLRQDPDFFAFYRSMQDYETGLKGSDTRMVMSPKSDFIRFFWHTQWSAGKARRGCAVCSLLAHDPHKSDHARYAAA